MKHLTALIKKKWLMKTMSTIILSIFIILAFFIINKITIKSNPKIADLTKSKIYSLTKQSKEKIKEVKQNVNIYLIGYDETSTEYILGKQYEEINDKIKCVIVDTQKRPDLALKYGATSENRIVVIEGPDKKYKVISSNEMIMTDNEENKSYDITEEKLTNAIQDVTVNFRPKVYFLTGHNEYSIENGGMLELFAQFIINDINEVSELNLKEQIIPKDCDLLIIANPTKDFAETEAKDIIEYIKNGGNIMWMQNPAILNRKDVTTYKEFKNINKVLDQYGISFSDGIVCESNSEQVIGGNPTMFSPVLLYHPILKDIYSSGKVYFFGTSKINIKSDEELENIGVKAQIIARTTKDGYYKEDKNIDIINQQTEKGQLNVAVTLEKKLENNKKSKMVAIGTAHLVSGVQLQIVGQENTTPISQLYNRQMGLKTVLYLTNRKEETKIRKNNGTVTFPNPTLLESTIVTIIIILLPAGIILAGIIIPVIRRKRK